MTRITMTWIKCCTEIAHKTLSAYVCVYVYVYLSVCMCNMYVCMYVCVCMHDFVFMYSFILFL